MYVWFYVLNHSKYRFPFHAVCIGIMNGIRKPAFHDARYNRLKCLDSDVRSRPFQSVRRAFFHLQTVVILHRERPALGGFSKFSQKIFRRGFCYRQITASCTFVRQTAFCPTKVLALRGRAFSRVERLFIRYHECRPKKNTTTPNAEL